MTIPEKEVRKANCLIREKSPYLLQHAYNPVNWYSWGDEAFEKAKQEDKPIFLSIGYSTCHWCHVMERESFEDDEVAELLNRDYVAIKVDREERPDIDSIYMSACQALTGQGGWPLSIFMTPDKKPFYAATYIPKHSQHHMLGLTDLLPRIADLWKKERSRVEESGQQLSEFLNREYDTSGEKLGEDVFKTARQHLARVFDQGWGGFSGAPKFPSPHNLYYLLRCCYYFADEGALQMVEKTLEAMYRGGIYDHIGGGFARYSTDRHWLVPHFEKMLYDNALLALAYLEAYQITGKNLYARVAREVFAYILREMTSPEGAFYSAQDADSEGVEGKFYVWDPAEVKAVLGKEDGDYFCRLYGISEDGNFEGKSIPNLIGSRLEPEEWPRIEQLRERLLHSRNQRVHPHQDDKILSSWNGLMIAALAVGARILDEPDYLKAASRAADFILAKLRRSDGRLLARYREGEALYPGYALDYAAMIWGLLELYQSGFEAKYLQTALELNSDLLKYFWDDAGGGLFLYGSDAEQLVARPKEAYDGALPSDNSIAALNFLRLGRLIGDSSLEQKGVEALNAFAGAINQHPTAYTFFLTAALFYSRKGKEIVIIGEREKEDTRIMLKTIAQRFLPDSVVLLKEPAERHLDKIAPFVQDMNLIDGKAAAYMCEGHSCQQPVTDAEQLASML